MTPNQAKEIISLIAKGYTIEVMHEKSTEDIYLILGHLKTQINGEWIDCIRYCNKSNRDSEFSRSIHDMEKLRIVYLFKGVYF